MGTCHDEPPFRRAPMSEERIQAVFVGGLPPSTGPIELHEPDPAWPSHFAREQRRIRSALGAVALLVEHVGSTSVPQLAAKPIIDVLLVVADSADERTYIPALEAAGYLLRIRESDWHQHRVLKGPDTNVNLHVFSRGCDEVGRMLLFRDRLRRDPAERGRYEAAKRALAQRGWQHVQNYADAKTAVVEAIIARAAMAGEGSAAPRAAPGT